MYLKKNLSFPFVSAIEQQQIKEKFCREFIFLVVVVFVNASNHFQNDQVCDI